MMLGLSLSLLGLLVCQLQLTTAPDGAPPSVTGATPFDLIIRHGRIVDGSGNPAYFGDVAVKNGRIAAIGRILDPASEVMEARGLVVAPGFIDVHTHAEEIGELPLADNFVRMGVTSLILGNCGGSVSDVGAFLRRLETNRVAVNVATLIGHNTVRAAAMGGSFSRPPTDSEMETMKSSIDRAMRDGAVGLSTGLIYLPGVFAKTGEIVELAKVAARFDGIYASHIRNEGVEIFAALEELFRVAREAQIRAEISHIKLSRPSAWGQTHQVIEAIERARAEGLDITQDQYVYTASSTGISQLIPEEAREGGPDQFLARLKNPEAKAKITAEMKRTLQRGGYQDYGYAVVAHYSSDPALNGKTIVEAAQANRHSTALDDQIELILEIHQNGGASGIFHGINETDLQQFARHPNTMFASDSGMRRFGEGVPHPRGYGNNARVLGRYVRELAILRLEDAIRRMSSLPATTFRLADRGVIRAGAWADLVIFDPATVRDMAGFNTPHQYPTGIRHVLVNGIPVIRESEHTGAKPGHALRRTDRP